MLACDPTRKTEASGAGCADDPLAKCVASTAKKGEEVDSPRLKYHRQIGRCGSFSAIVSKHPSSEFFRTGADHTAAASAPFVGLRPTPETLRRTATEGCVGADENVLDISTNDSVMSLASDFARLRRRHRRHTHVLLTEPDGEEKKLQNLKQALESLEEMQRENKERMQRVGAHFSGTRGRIPADGSGGVDKKSALFFSRTQSVGGRPHCDLPRQFTFERAMTMSLVPDPKAAFSRPLSPKQQNGSSVSGTFALPLPRPDGSPTMAKDSEARVHARQRNVSTSHTGGTPSSYSITSPKKELGAAEKGGAERRSLLPCKSASSPPRGCVAMQRSNSESQGLNRSQGGKTTTASDTHASPDGVANTEERSQIMTVSDKGKTAKEKLTGVSQGSSSKRQLSTSVRPGGRSVSPPIIILTVDSRRNMNEEEARRLLSADPVQHPHHHQRPFARFLTVRPEWGTSDERPNLKKPSLVKDKTKSPTGKDLSTPVATTSKKRLVPEARGSVGLSPTKKAQAGAPVVAATKREAATEEHSEASGRCGVLNSRPPQLKSSGSAGTPPRGQDVKKKTLTGVKGASSAPLTEPRPGKGPSEPPKAAAAAASAEQKEKTPPRRGRRNGALNNDLTNATVAEPNSRRRKIACATRVLAVRREEPSSTQDKGPRRDLKGTSPPHFSEEGSNTSQRGGWPQLMWREKNLSALTHAGFLEHDMYRPLATDRPTTASRVYAQRRASFAETRITKHLVPFCTECGKRHLSDKVKFCAFCGHKRELVR